jgi:hypothetical protein
MEDDTDIAKYLDEKYWICQFMEMFDAEEIFDKEDIDEPVTSDEITIPPF